MYHTRYHTTHIDDVIFLRTPNVTHFNHGSHVVSDHGSDPACDTPCDTTYQTSYHTVYQFITPSIRPYITPRTYHTKGQRLYHTAYQTPYHTNQVIIAPTAYQLPQRQLLLPYLQENHQYHTLYHTKGQSEAQTEDRSTPRV